MLFERTGLTPENVIALAKKDPDRLREFLVRDVAKLKEDGWLDFHVSKLGSKSTKGQGP